MRKKVKKLYRGTYFDAEAHQVVIGNETITLNYNEALLLDYMLENKNVILDKRALIEAGWPDSVVTDSSLHKSINRLRSIFESKDTVKIETITGKGYVLRIAENRTLNVIYNKNLSIVIYLTSFVLIASALYVYLSIPRSADHINDGYHALELDDSKYNKNVILPSDKSLPPYILAEIKKNECNCTFFYIVPGGRKYEQLSMYDPEINDVVNFIFMEGERK